MLGLFFFFVLGLVPTFISAQNTAQCLSDQKYQWTFNSRGESPCDVAWDLGSICTPGLQIGPLPPDHFYSSPTGANATSCRCSSVYYSVIAACGFCQNRNNVKWSNYKTNCPAVYLTVFPSAIPSTTKVPRWAYLDVSNWDGFNITAARLTAQAGGEGPPPPSSSSNIGTGTSTSTRNTNTQTEPPLSGSGSKTNTGAIIGGVVGGVVFIGLVGAVVFFLLKRKRKAATKYAYNGVLGDTPTAGNYAVGSYPSSTPSPKPYDPNDPSTFPTSENLSYGGFSHSPTPYPVVAQYNGTSYPSQSSFPSNPMPPSRPQYTGTPEL